MNAVHTIPDCQTAGALTRRLFGSDVAIASLDPREDHGHLWRTESAPLLGASELRRREFKAGRAAARLAMARIGFDVVAIPMNTDRSPHWPDGLIGSISHCKTACVSIVARSENAVGLGVDIETVTPFDEDIADVIYTPEEQTWLENQSPAVRDMAATLIFSAKEAAYKAQFPLTERIVGFDAMTVSVDLKSKCFFAELNYDIGPLKSGFCIEGQFATSGQLIVTGVILRSQEYVHPLKVCAQ